MIQYHYITKLFSKHVFSPRFGSLVFWMHVYLISTACCTCFDVNTHYKPHIVIGKSWIGTVGSKHIPVTRFHFEFVTILFLLSCDHLLYIGVKILFMKLAAMSGVLIPFLHVSILYFVTACVSPTLPILVIWSFTVHAT